MKILITMLSILYSSYLYADLNLDESYSYPMLREKLELNRNLNINQRTYVDHDIENPPKPYKPKDKCMTAICMDPKVVMSKKPIKDYSDEYEVEDILEHKGLWARKAKMSFLVKWLGYEDSTWEPWANVSNSSMLDEYLIRHGREKLSPRYKATE